MFKKAICILALMIVATFSVSCIAHSSNTADSTEHSTTYEEDLTNNHTDDTTVGDIDLDDKTDQCLQGTLPPPTENEPYLLSDTLMFKITKNYLSTCFFEFEYGDEVPFEEIVNYYSFDGCFSFDERTFSEDAHKYYDDSTMSFTVPSEVVHEFLCEKFNTLPTPEKTDCYNEKTDCYEFPRHLGTYNFDAKIVRKVSPEKNVYDFTVDLTYSLDETASTGYYCSFTVELNEIGYKYLSVKIEEK